MKCRNLDDVGRKVAVPDQPQYIGSNRSHVVIKTEAWEEAQQKPAMGPWLIDSLSISEELELPPLSVICWTPTSFLSCVVLSQNLQW